MKKLVKLSNITKYYDQKLILDNISFEILEGQIATLIGPNGAGKSTLLKIILGFLKADSGEIEILSDRISYVPQKFSINKTVPIKVKDFLNLSSSYLDGSDKLISEFFNLEKYYDKLITELSGGELQQVLLISAISSKPEILILDEPTQGLDIDAQDKFYKLLDILRKDYGMAIILVSHDLFIVMKSADKILHLNHNICCEGSAENISKDLGLDNMALYKHNSKE